MNVVYFTHSLSSCWNHGNAHFVRGVLRALIDKGCRVRALEPSGAWSLANLLQDHGPEGLGPWREAYPELTAETYEACADLEALCEGADLVILHEWNDPALASALGRLRARGARFTLLFHDTHHRAVSDPDAMSAFDLDGFDGVLAFGEALAAVYRRWGWGERVFVWHEAADTRLFRPPAGATARSGLIFIGNWGDEERSGELERFLLEPARRSGLSLDIYGVRYPPAALDLVRAAGARYHGWLANASVPQAFASRRATVHVPRRYYADQLPGIPTIRVFEALACGIPLLSAPWSDQEGLFRVGRDFLMAGDGGEAERLMRRLNADADLCESLARSGLETIRARHTCAHRADALLAIVATIRQEARRDTRAMEGV